MVATIGLCCWLSSAFAQPYASIFGEDSTRMSILVEYPDLFQTMTFIGREGDTVLKGEHIYLSFQTIPFTGAGTYFLREEVETGKVWAIYPMDHDEQERLIMDMTLEMGDTMFYPSPHGGIDAIPVVEVFTLNGRKHIKMKMDLPLFSDDSLTFIEGVGPTGGFTWQLLYRSVLLCSYVDEQQIFQNPNVGSDCRYELVEIQGNSSQKENASLHIGKDGMLMIRVSDQLHQPIQVKLFDLVGKSLFQTTLFPSSGSGEIPIELPHQLPRVVVVMVSSEGKVILSQKVNVNH